MRTNMTLTKQIFDETKENYKNQLIGGIGDESQPDDFDQEQLYMGVVVEFEHTKDPMLAMELAIDHLSEFPDYYIRLDKMEDEAESELLNESVESIGERFKKVLDKWWRKHSDDSEMTYYRLDDEVKKAFDAESKTLTPESIPSPELINIMHMLEIPVPGDKPRSVVTKRDPKFDEKFNDSISKIDGIESPHRSAIPNHRGINHDKVRKTLKTLSSSRGSMIMRSEILNMGTVDAVAANMYYHGSANHIERLKAGVSLPKHIERGGGYEAMQHSISLTKSKRVASAFSGTSRYMRIYTVLLRKNARVIDAVGKVHDATELDDYIPELWAAKIDAVWIGGGEQELVVLNPKCIVNGNSDHYDVYGMRSSDINDDDTRKFIESYGLMVDENGNISKPNANEGDNLHESAKAKPATASKQVAKSKLTQHLMECRKQCQMASEAQQKAIQLSRNKTW